MPMFASRPLTTSSKHPVDIPQNCVVGQQRQQMSELQFDKFPNPSSFLVWKTRFKTQVSSGSDFPSEAMLWIKEVEMVDSLDELLSSRSVYGKDFPNFEMLDEKIASALNKIIQNSQFKKKGAQNRGPVSFAGDRSLTRSTTTFELLALMIQFLIRLFFSLSLFATMMFRNSIRDGDEILLSMTKIPVDDVLENLYKLRIRESDQFKTVLELYDMESHQNISMPNYQKLKTMVKRSIDQKLRLRNFDARKSKQVQRSRVTGD